MSAVAELAKARGPGPWKARMAALWRWWTGELREMLPQRLRFLSGMADGPVIGFDGDDLVLYEIRAAGAAEVARTSLRALDPEGCRVALRNLLARSSQPASPARLSLARAEVLARRVSLPLATEENLSQVLGFEMDRITPFHASEVYFDHRVASRDLAGGKIEVDFVAARRDLVDTRVAQVREWGGAVQAVVPRDDLSRPPPHFDLLPDEHQRSGDATPYRPLIRALAIAAAVLFAVALVLPIWQKRETVIALLPVVEKAKGEAESTDKIARDLDRQVGDYNFVLGRRHAAPPVLAYLEELSRVLPDNTWVQQLDIKALAKSHEVTIVGESASASKLIEILEQAKGVQNASPRGSITRGSVPGVERFSIVAEARNRPLPDSQSPVTPSAAPAPVVPATPAAAPAASPPAAQMPPQQPSPTGAAPATAQPKAAAQPPAKRDESRNAPEAKK
jgi:general secretion pathway protein L